MARGPRARLATAFLIVSTVLAGCAKRPATTVARAPAPTTGATTRAPAGAAPAPGTASGTDAVPRATDGPAPTGQAAPGSTATPGPPARASAPQEFKSIGALKDVHFDFDRYDIHPADTSILDENVRWMKANEGESERADPHRGLR